jgi:hypothetical protein
MLDVRQSAESIELRLENPIGVVEGRVQTR